ncbi:MAG: hypothetical protein MK135_08255 [Polyangiaceae bacterium]|nr:hypothetical protein [Polyangiaceae bacterium]
MLWAALAAAIMVLSGSGDDTAAIRKLIGLLDKAIAEHVSDADRKARAEEALRSTMETFEAHRKTLEAMGRCVQEVDARYDAKEADYEDCVRGLDQHYVETAAALEKSHRVLLRSVHPDEWEKISQAVFRRDKKQVLVKSLKEVRTRAEASKPDRRRQPGLGGVFSNRHITLPQNALNAMIGPLTNQTFGQRYQFGVVEGGVGYARQASSSSEGALGNPLALRMGVGFGIFPDFEAGALFLPMQFQPDFEFLQILVFFTYQLRFEHLDVGLRLSFLSPDGKTIPLNPGVSVVHRSKDFRVEFAALAPMSVVRGTGTDVGLNFPLRGVYQLTPRLFTLLETGYFRGDIPESATQAVPLTLGLGWTQLFGDRVFDFTASFSWDQFYSPGAPSGEQLNAEAYRIQGGLNMQHSVF